MANEHMRFLLFIVIIIMSLHIGAMEEGPCYPWKRELRRMEIETLKAKIERYPRAPSELKSLWSNRLTELTRKETKAEAKREMVDVLLGNDAKGRSRQKQDKVEEEEALPSENTFRKNTSSDSHEKPTEKEGEEPEENEEESTKPKFLGQKPSIFWFAKLFSFSLRWASTTHFFSANLLRFTIWKMPLFGPKWPSQEKRAITPRKSK